MFLRVAAQHLGAAGILAKTRQYGGVAKYLGGYSVECALKALVLHEVPPNAWDETLERITRGAAGHSLIKLRAELLDARVTFPPRQLIRSFQVVVSWSTELRYQPKFVDAEEVNDFLLQAKQVVDWVEGRIP